MIPLSDTLVNPQTVKDEYGRTVADLEGWIVSGAGKPDQVKRWTAELDALKARGTQAAAAIDPIGALMGHLHRGGAYGYYWDLLLETYTDPSTGKEKRRNKSTWFKVGARPAPPKTTGDMYFGVHPGTTAKGEYQAIKTEEVAAVNTMYAEFDAAHFVDVPDMDIDALANAILQAEPKTKLQAARATAKAELQKQWAAAEPERYKRLALAHIHRLALQPTVIIDSGGGYHCYWLLRETFILATPSDRAAAIHRQAAWVDLEQADPGAKDLRRVLRVPGTLNTKYNPPRRVAIIESDFVRLYTLSDFDALLPAQTPRKPKATAAARQAVNHADPGAAAWAQKQLGRLSPTRADSSYTPWLHVGMALSWLGDEGLFLWDAWSQQSDQYTEGECEAKFATFKREIGGELAVITLGSLEHWANEDDPQILQLEPKADVTWDLDPDPDGPGSPGGTPRPGPKIPCGSKGKIKFFAADGSVNLQILFYTCNRNDCKRCMARRADEYITKILDRIDLTEQLGRGFAIREIATGKEYTAETRKLRGTATPWAGVLGTNERMGQCLLLSEITADLAAPFGEIRDALYTWLDGKAAPDMKPSARLVRTSKGFFASEKAKPEAAALEDEAPAGAVCQVEPIASPGLMAKLDIIPDDLKPYFTAWQVFYITPAEFKSLLDALGLAGKWQGKGCTVNGLSFDDTRRLMRGLTRREWAERAAA